MTGATGDDVPRLPPRPPVDPRLQQLELDLPTPAPAVTVQLDLDWPPFHAPSLFRLGVERWAVVVARVIAFLWSAALVVAAVRARSDALAGREVDSSVAQIGRLGIGVAGLIAITGWCWSDRATRNVLRLGGRRPTRLRCLTAWALPLVYGSLLAVTVVRLEPTELVDVRPLIVVPIMALTVWRPYSLVRRILATLSRLRSDALVGTAYVLEVSGFGLLWWRLATWPDTLTAQNIGSADLLIGIGSAATVGFAAGVVVWAVLLRDVDRAQAHRLLALRTRHDHRHLRLRGINPMDPEVRWALLRIRQQEELERRAAAEQEHAPPGTEAPAASPIAAEAESISDVGPLVTEIVTSDAREQIIADLVAEIASAETSANKMIADLVEEATAETSPSVAGTSIEELATALSNLPTHAQPPSTERAAATTDVGDEAVSEAATADAAAAAPTEPVEEAATAETPAHAAPAAAKPAVESISDFAANLRSRLRSARDERAREERARQPPAEPATAEPATAEPARPATAEERAARLSRRLEDVSEPGDQRVSPVVAQTPESTADLAASATPHLPGSLAQRLAHERNGGGREDPTSRIDRLAGRLATPGSEQPRSLLQRLEEYGIRPSVTGSGTFDVPPEVDIHPGDRWVPPRLYELEAVRYLMLLGLAAVIATSAWIVTRTASVGTELPNGEIPATNLDRIDLARRAFVTALGISYALVALWAAVVGTFTHRAGMPESKSTRAYVLFGVAVVLNAASFVLDGETRGTFSFVLLLLTLAATLAAVTTVGPVARWFERRTTSLTLWTAGLPLLAAMSWLGGLQRPVSPTDALETLTFVAALQAIVAGILVVIAALSTSDLEDAIRVSPGLGEVRRQQRV